MKKLLAVTAIACGIAAASCSNHGAGSMIPGAGNAIAPADKGSAVAGALDLGRASGVSRIAPSQPITIHVGLQLRHVGELKALIAARHVIGESEFVQRFGPSPLDVAKVETYLRRHGFERIAHERNNLIVHATAPASAVERAFGTRLASFDLEGGRYYGNVAPARVPAQLKGVVVAVLGLNDAPAVKTPHDRGAEMKRAAPTPAPSTQPCTANEAGVCARFYDPPSFQIAYDAANAPTAKNTTIAIFTEGDLSTAISDFRWNEQEFHLPQVPVRIVQAEPASTDTSGNGEWTLDMTYSSGMAGTVKQLLLYNFTALGDADIVNAYDRWVSDDKAQVGNSSFGGCEIFPYQDGSMVMADEVLSEAAAQGQTMFVSSGDNGGYCNNLVDTNGAPGGVPMVEWPASSPYVVAVGGTDLFTNPDGTYMGETSWEAGGGGLSQFEYSPSWESGVQPVGTTPAGYSFRGVPDVAMDASLETGALLYESGSAVNGSCTPCTTGGTSLASPLAAGAYARMQSAHGNELGFGAVAFYNVYNANPSASETSAPPPTQLVGGFHDVLSGSNGLYTALPRYDYTTGLGSFDVLKTNGVIAE